MTLTIIWQRLVAFVKRLVCRRVCQQESSSELRQTPTGEEVLELSLSPSHAPEDYPYYDSTWDDAEPDYFPDPVVVKKSRKTTKKAKMTKTKKSKTTSKRVR